MNEADMVAPSTEARALRVVGPAPCGTCGLCCRRYLVPLCGRDVWRISRDQRLAPEQFVFACTLPKPAADGFLLDPAATPYQLVLDKRGRLRQHAPCVFLVELGGGYSRCGIYEQRPVVCQAYPMRLDRGVTALRPDVLCPSDSWPPALLAQPSWRAAVQRQRMHFDTYHLVVARWNDYLASPDAGSGAASLGDYLSYLMNVYERLDALEREVGTEQLAEVEGCWNLGAASPTDPAGDAIWTPYAEEVHEIVKGFFSAIPA